MMSEENLRASMNLWEKQEGCIQFSISCVGPAPRKGFQHLIELIRRVLGDLALLFHDKDLVLFTVGTCQDIDFQRLPAAMHLSARRGRLSAKLLRQHLRHQR